MQNENGFTQPKFAIGSSVLLAKLDATHVPSVTQWQVAGILFSPDIDGFHCRGWAYLLKSDDDTEQTFASQSDLVAPVDICDFREALGGIAAQIEILKESLDYWETDPYQELPAQLKEAQYSIFKIMVKVPLKDEQTESFDQD